MYLDYFGLAEAPFRITPHTEFFFSGANRGATLDALLYAATHEEGIIKICGEVGSGKTMLCRVLMERLPKEVTIVYLSNPSLSRDDILYAIADELALTLPENARFSAALKVLQTHLINLYAEGRRVVVLIDEAHAMPMATLEEIRLLSNLESNRNKLLQLVFFGQPELDDTLARADMRQLKERITQNFALEPLVRDDIAEYLEFRMRAAGYKGPNVFTPAANKLIHDTSKGLTRRINILADKSLLAAFAAGTHEITAKEVRAAILDCDFSKATSVPAQRKLNKRLALLAIVAIIALAAIIAVVIGRGLKHTTLPANEAAASVTPPSALTTPITKPGTVTGASPAGTNKLTASKTATSATTTVANSEPVTAVASTTKIAGPLTEQALTRGQTWLAATPNNRWFLQLFAVDAGNAISVENYLHRLTMTQDSEKIHAYLSSLSGTMRYGVIYGDYQDRAAALAAIEELPSWVQDTKPYARQVKRLR
jgi:type II secretory pathway predicted ATPase ExeA